MEWYLLAWRRCADFGGRSQRMEYWMFMAIHCGLFLAIEITIAFLVASRAHPTRLGLAPFFAWFLYGLAALVPFLAVSVRRLHDVGKSGWWMLLAFLPIIDLLLIVFFTFDSEAGENEYGPNPKLPASPALIG